MRFFICLIPCLLLSACSGLSPYRSVGPVDQAIKACGLGYSTDVAAVFKGAFQYAADVNSSKGIDFSASMNDSLKTQIGAMLDSKELGSKERAEIISNTQACVVRLSNAYRPKTRGELVKTCVEDLQDRVEGAGSKKTSDTIRNWVVDSVDNAGGFERLKVRASFHPNGGEGYPASFLCLIKDGSYEDVEQIKGK